MAGLREKVWGKKKHFREGQSDQVLSDLFFDFLDLVAYLKPKVVVAENVKGMLLGAARGYVKLVVSRLKELGYRTQVFLLDAADCGVPQHRERVFFCSLRGDIEAPPLVLLPKHRHISAEEACRDLSPLTEKEVAETAPSPLDRKWWPLTPCGSDYGSVRQRREGKRATFSHKKLDGRRPSFTLTANSRVLKHWSECRTLTFREWKRLGSFPDDYVAKSPTIGKYLIGMSVPPRMAEFVARAVASQWLLPNHEIQ